MIITKADLEKNGTLTKYYAGVTSSTQKQTKAVRMVKIHAPIVNFGKKQIKVIKDQDALYGKSGDYVVYERGNRFKNLQQYSPQIIKVENLGEIKFNVMSTHTGTVATCSMWSDEPDANPWLEFFQKFETFFKKEAEHARKVAQAQLITANNMALMTDGSGLLAQFIQDIEVRG